MTYRHHDSHYFLPVDQCDDVLSSAYNYSWHTTIPEDHHRTLHRHAVAFSFLATASLFDPQLPPRVSLRLPSRCPCSFVITFGYQSVEASRYYELACAALAGTHVDTDPTVEAVQALVRSVRLAISGKS
jgi:hypothetical protein